MRKQHIEERARIVQEYLHKYHGYGYRTIAKAIHTNHPSLFKSVENARTAIRTATGANGRNKRKDRQLDAPMRSNQESEDHRNNPFKIPHGDHKEYVPFRVDSDVRKITVFSDVHVPYHSVEALEPAIKRAKKYKPDALLLNGDFLDCHTLSRFLKEKDARDFKSEILRAREILSILCEEIAPKYVYYKEGNHEERYSIYMRSQSPELLDIPDFNFERVLGLDAIGADFIGEKRVIYAGKLSIIHGHEYVGGAQSPVSPSRGFFMKGVSSILSGHHHNTSEYTQPDIRGKITACFSVGCMCDLNPLYMRQNKWNHGFAEVSLDSEGDFEVDNYRIYRGKIL